MVKKKLFLCIFGAIFLLPFLLIVFGCRTDSTGIDTLPEGDKKSTLSSLKKLNNYPFYSMTYSGDYGFEKKLAKNSEGSKNIKKHGLLRSKSLKGESWGCTCFAALGKGENKYFGRNFDWHYCIPLILFTRAPNAYSSVSMVDLEYLGYNPNNLPDDPAKREKLMDAPFLPFDGLNEKGVAIGMMAIESADPPFDRSKKNLDELELIRLVLDYADNVEKAIELIKEYNIIMSTVPIHYLISDTSGKSVVIEFVDKQIICIRTDELFQVSTNFLISKSNAPDNVTCWRYNKAYSSLKNSEGKLSFESSMDLLNQVSQQNTIWSIVYEMKSGNIKVVNGRDYRNSLALKLN